MTAFAEYSPKGREYALRVPHRRYPLVRTHEGIDYEVNKVTRANQWELRDRVLPFERDFGYNSSYHTYNKVIHYVRPGAEVVFARLLDSSRKEVVDVGVVTEELKKVNIRGEQKRVLSIGIRVVSEAVQQRDIGGNLLNEAITRHRPYAITGLSRTWRIFRMLEKSPLIAGITPIDAPYTHEEEEILEEVLDKSTLSGISSLRTGLCYGILPKVDIKNLIPPLDNIKGVEMYNKMWSGLRANARPEQGDAIRYFAYVNQEEIDKLIQTGWEDPKQTLAIRAEVSLAQRVIDILSGILPGNHFTE